MKPESMQGPILDSDGYLSTSLKTLLEHGYFQKFGEGCAAVYRRVK